jgi:hypothetical protein
MSNRTPQHRQSGADRKSSFDQWSGSMAPGPGISRPVTSERCGQIRPMVRFAAREKKCEGALQRRLSPAA